MHEIGRRLSSSLCLVSQKAHGQKGARGAGPCAGLGLGSQVMDLDLDRDPGLARLAGHESSLRASLAMSNEP